ncbi:hypothetical protein DV711_05805 [Motiliproteus coralliicola]|uniref:Tetratricopeptide repeat protein n=1 Tax=Motiliproteus coralliicola TaxID=2283196 RepID=A0A369WZX5_9GAMM|nr:hypothetical protein [Motiliproteus coralliicola]RDE25075.1 hypothetical protein DV711_05805 [Motiliproteus coralliicola]
MDYCKYHPLVSATYTCPNCETSMCDSCVDEGGFRGIERCFVCGSEVEGLGAANSIEPFWRRLQQSFRYPMNKSTMLLIIGVSVLSTILASYGSLITFLLWVGVSGVMIKYSFLCLQNTANGLLVAPGTGDAFQGGVHLIINILGIFLVMSGAIYAAGIYLGPGIASTLSVIFTIGLPAVLINYAISERFTEAINPLSMLQLIFAIGLPYGLLLGFILIMSGSVGIISGVIGDKFSILSAALQSVVFYYYMVVVFHMMGYIIFQNQQELGFSARENYGVEREVRSAKALLLARIDIQVKEGLYQEALDSFRLALKEYPNDKDCIFNCFEFLYSTGNRSDLVKFAPRYFNFLLSAGRQDQLYPGYKKLLQLDQNYQPASAELRHHLARACQQSGNPRLAVKLLAGLHRDFPEYEALAEAYRLLAQCLDELPAMADKAEQCRKLAARFEQRQPPEQPPLQEQDCHQTVKSPGDAEAKLME